ncbi:permease [Acidicapsa acidisoli]|uniref:permease n=1 Tax=Acidicapsa acidisoli TaxID=1615681 RepID=UPI0021DF62E0|nr:permease [Acidicapsa acidisoli]
MLRRLPILQLRKKSLIRGTVLALVSLWVSFRLSGFPEVHICLWLIAPFLITCAATWDTTRCLQKRWSFYHGGVILLIYVDLMILLMISFLLIAPFSGVLL